MVLSVHREHRTTIASVVCDCGAKTEINISRLRNGQTMSCGCLRRETTRGRATTHGLSGTREYDVWCAMKNRCGNPNDKVYDSYGGRGIVVCERWEKFENFIADMGQRPSSRHTIERVENNDGYNPDNCIWEIKKENCRNRRDSRFLLIDGVKFVQAAAIEIFGFNPATFGQRTWRARKSGVAEFDLLGHHVVVLPNDDDSREKASAQRA